MRISNSYHQETMSAKSLKLLIREIAPQVRVLRKKLKFDAIAFRGFSGAAVAYPLSVATGIPLLLVRKVDNNGKNDSHGHYVEGDGNIDVKRYVIIDDFVCSGETIRTIVNQIHQFHKGRYGLMAGEHLADRPKCVGVLLYTKGYRNSSNIHTVDGEFSLTYLAKSGC